MVKKTPSPFSNDVIDSLLGELKGQEAIFGKGGLFKQLTKALVERAMEEELTTELGYEKHDASGNNSGNSRNGYSKKRLQCEHGAVDLDIPRDREGNYSPQIIPKHERRFKGFDEKILAMYGHGLSTHDIQAQIEDLYGVEVSPTLISNVTNAVLDEVREWQNRPLDSVYPIVYLDAIVIKVRHEKSIINKAFHVALGVNMAGEKELLGIWVTKNEGSKFWLNVLTELKNRGVEDIFIACVDGLKGFPDAIETAYPQATVQLCIVHMVRNSLKYVGWKERKAVAADLRAVYTQPTAEAAENALTAFESKWDEKFPSISKQWRTKWENVIPFFAYPEDIRKVIYTTNAIESLNASLRKYVKNKRVFPSDESALKQLFLSLKNIEKKWTMPVRNWRGALNRFAIMFEDRLPEKYR